MLNLHLNSANYLHKAITRNLSDCTFLRDVKILPGNLDKILRTSFFTLLINYTINVNLCKNLFFLINEYTAFILTELKEI